MVTSPTTSLLPSPEPFDLLVGESPGLRSFCTHARGRRLSRWTCRAFGSSGAILLEHACVRRSLFLADSLRKHIVKEKAEEINEGSKEKVGPLTGIRGRREPGARELHSQHPLKGKMLS